MKKRVTISLDDKLIWLLRNKQAEMMVELNLQVSISSIVSFLLNKAIKAENMINSELDSVFVHPNGMHFQVDKILERIYEYGVEPQIIQDMNLSQDALFHIYSRLEEASLRGASLSLADVFEIIYSTLKV